MVESGFLEEHQSFNRYNLIKLEKVIEIKEEYEKLFNITINNKVQSRERVYFAPEIDFPRYKFKTLADTLDANRTIKAANADVIIIKRSGLNDFINRFMLSKKEEYVKTNKQHPFSTNNISEPIFQKVDISSLVTPKSDLYKKFLYDEEFVKKLDIFDYIIKNQKNFKFVDIVDLQDEISSITGVNVDEPTITNINQLLSSDDEGNFQLGREMLSNLNIKDAPFTIYYIAKFYNHKLRNINDVNIRGFNSVLTNLVNDTYTRTYGPLVTRDNLINETLREFYNNDASRSIKMSAIITEFDKGFILKTLKEELHRNLILKELKIDLNYE